MILWCGIGTVLLAFGISALATPVTQRLAERMGMLDVPERHKAHARAVPLLGGCAVFAAILLPSVLALALARVWSAYGTPSWLPEQLAIHIDGASAKAYQALGILGGAMVLHIIGLIDDRRNLGAWLKLISELVVCAAVVIAFHIRVLTVAGATVSTIASILWLTAITNAFNFLDNMDGLSSGVAAICAAALLGASASIGQVFVSAWLCLILGAVLGFLPYNFPPARTFLGDAGALVIGFLLGVVSCLTTYVQPGEPYYLYGVFVPLVLMAVPLYDMGSVILLRVIERRNPMVGDRRHFSHRLVRRGMKPRSAVLTIYLCTAGTAISASLLPHVRGTVGAVLVFLQTIITLLIIALLEAGDTRP
jgi:UDP-GlcNAc:undecaprenyl-phosphate GlcNAc-1-phosphate transferase